LRNSNFSHLAPDLLELLSTAETQSSQSYFEISIVRDLRGKFPLTKAGDRPVSRRRSAAMYSKTDRILTESAKIMTVTDPLAESPPRNVRNNIAEFGLRIAKFPSPRRARSSRRKGVFTAETRRTQSSDKIYLAQRRKAHKGKGNCGIRIAKCECFQIGALTDERKNSTADQCSAGRPVGRRRSAVIYCNTDQVGASYFLIDLARML
jgi:hypothetical protein